MVSHKLFPSHLLIPPKDDKAGLFSYFIGICEFLQDFYDLLRQLHLPTAGITGIMNSYCS